MNATELAKAMIEYEELQRKLDVLGDQIKATVLELGKTQTVGNLTASYSGGRKSYDYETAAVESPLVDETLIVSYTTEKIVKSTDYRTLCADLKIEAPFTQSDPSVTLKIKG